MYAPLGFFFGGGRKVHQKYKGVSLYRTPKFQEKKGNTPEEKGIPRKGKNKEFQESKERSLRFQIASWLDLQSLAIWASKCFVFQDLGRICESRARRCRSGPNCLLEGPPHPPHCNWRTLPSSHSPSFTTLSLPLPPTPPGSFCNAPEEGRHGWCGGEVLPRVRGGVRGGGPSKLHLRLDPHTSGGTRESQC